MKKLISLISFSIALSTSVSSYADLNKGFNSLGASEGVISKAKALDTKNKVQIVQNRLVDRTMRFEIGANIAGAAGGDSYVKSTGTGANLDFHFTPQWSVGLRYMRAGNELTSQGKRVFGNYEDGLTSQVPDISFPLESAMGVINWYPIYGKLNMFNISVVQFDIYALAGGGQVTLGGLDRDDYTAPTYTAGGGVGFWINQHLTARFELRWQGYKDEVFSGSRTINQTIGTVGIGILL